MAAVKRKSRHAQLASLLFESVTVPTDASPAFPAKVNICDLFSTNYIL